MVADEFASNRLVNVKSMSEEELKVIQKYYSKLSQLTKHDERLQQSHSIDEAGKKAASKKDVEDGIKNDVGRR